MEKLYLFVTGANRTKNEATGNVMLAMGGSVKARNLSEAYSNVRKEYGIMFPVFL